MRRQQDNSQQRRGHATLEGRFLGIAIRDQNEHDGNRRGGQKGEEAPIVGNAEKRQQEEPVKPWIGLEMFAQVHERPHKCHIGC